MGVGEKKTEKKRARAGWGTGRARHGGYFGVRGRVGLSPKMFEHNSKLAL